MAIMMSNDYGFGNNKSLYVFKGETIKRSFESRYIEGEGVTGQHLTFNSKDYTFGEGKIAADYDHNTKDHEVHRLLLWKAMYDCYLKTGEKDFFLVVTCGMDSWKKDKGESVAKYMSEIKSITVEDENNKVKLNIKELSCYPETLMGALTTKLKLKEEDELLILDIGTKNFQLLKMESGRPLTDLSYSTEYGMNRIYTEICDRVKNLQDARIKSHNAVKTYLKKTALKEIDVISEVDDVILEYLTATVFEEIDNRLKHLEISRFAKFVVIGGGAIFLERFLKAKYIDNEIHFVEDPFYANTIGLYKKGLSVYKTKIKGDSNGKENK